MPIVACHECRAPISSDARACPQCGATRTRDRKAKTILYALILVLVLGWIAFKLLVAVNPNS